MDGTIEEEESVSTPPLFYWLLAGVLTGFGVIALLSIGIPFLLVGCSLLMYCIAGWLLAVPSRVSSTIVYAKLRREFWLLLVINERKRQYLFRSLMTSYGFVKVYVPS